MTFKWPSKYVIEETQLIQSNEQIQNGDQLLTNQTIFMAEIL